MAATSQSNSLACIPESLSLSFLQNCDQISTKSIEKGLNYYQQGYIHEVTIHAPTVFAKCWPSLRKTDPPHKLSLDLDSDRIKEAYCSCKAGLSGKCSHIIGLIKTLQGFKLHNFKEIPSDLSSTSMPQQWNKPRGDRILPVPISQVVVARPTEQRKRKPIQCSNNMNYKLPKVDLTSLQAVQDTPLLHRTAQGNGLSSVKTPMGDVPIGSALSYQIRHVKNETPSSHKCGSTSVNLTPPVNLPQEFCYLNDRKTIHKDPKFLEFQTQCQSSELWYEERKKRITSSNFGKVISRKKTPNQSFLNSIFINKNIKAKSLEYGKKHESDAKARYLQQYPDRHFHSCGFVVNNEFSFLGGTPDGKICDNGDSGVIEIKCPYSARNMTIDNACESSDFFLKKEDGKFSLKKSHNYYAQVQGQLMVTGCTFCEFIVFTQLDMHVERISPDIPFMQAMLVKLALFYRDHALPYLNDATSNEQ